METLLRIQDIEKYYGSKSYITKAVDHISFEGNFSESWEHPAVEKVRC